MNVILNLNIVPKNLIKFARAIEPFCDTDSWMRVEPNSEPVMAVPNTNISELERETQAKEEKKEEKKPVKSEPKKELDTKLKTKLDSELKTEIDEPAQRITLAELKPLARKWLEADRNEELKAIFAKYGAEKISGVRVENYPEFKKDLEAINE